METDKNNLPDDQKPEESEEDFEEKFTEDDIKIFGRDFLASRSDFDRRRIEKFKYYQKCIEDTVEKGGIQDIYDYTVELMASGRDIKVEDMQRWGWVWPRLGEFLNKVNRAAQVFSIIEEGADNKKTIFEKITFYIEAYENPESKIPENTGIDFLDDDIVREGFFSKLAQIVMFLSINEFREILKERKEDYDAFNKFLINQINGVENKTKRDLLKMWVGNVAERIGKAGNREGARFWWNFSINEFKDHIEGNLSFKKLNLKGQEADEMGEKQGEPIEFNKNTDEREKTAEKIEIDKNSAEFIEAKAYIEAVINKESLPVLEKIKKLAKDAHILAKKIGELNLDDFSFSEELDLQRLIEYMEKLDEHLESCHDPKNHKRNIGFLGSKTIAEKEYNNLADVLAEEYLINQNETEELLDFLNQNLSTILDNFKRVKSMLKSELERFFKIVSAWRSSGKFTGTKLEEAYKNAKRFVEDDLRKRLVKIVEDDTEIEVIEDRF